LKRRKCYYDGDDQNIHDGDETTEDQEIHIDLDEYVQNRKSKNCTNGVGRKSSHSSEE